MVPDWLSFPSIPSEPSQPARPSAPVPAESNFAALYDEAMQTANQEMSQLISADCSDSGSDASIDDPIGNLQFRSSLSAFGAGSPFAPMSTDFAVTQEELMQQVAAIRLRQGTGIGGSSTASVAGTAATSQGGPSEIHRLISWLDSHAHLHSSHQCAASVRQAMEAAGIQTADRPPSGDAGDYGPFLMRHGAQVIAQETYAPKAGDIAVFDRSDDHPAGHIQVFDGQHWVSDFVQHTFSPYRDQDSTPPVTVYRLS